MLHNMLKWGVLLGIWRRYGAALKVLPFVLILLLVIFSVHNDYLNYVKVGEDQRHLALSFVVKWGVIVLVGFLYWRYVKRTLSRSSDATVRPARSGRGRPRGAETPESEAPTEVEQPDPFANIRDKKHLRSRAEWVIEKKKH